MAYVEAGRRCNARTRIADKILATLCMTAPMKAIRREKVTVPRRHRPPTATTRRPAPARTLPPARKAGFRQRTVERPRPGAPLRPPRRPGVHPPDDSPRPAPAPCPPILPLAARFQFPGWPWPVLFSARLERVSARVLAVWAAASSPFQ